MSGKIHWPDGGAAWSSGSLSWTTPPFRARDSVQDQLSRLRHFDTLRNKVHSTSATMEQMDEWDFIETVRGCLVALDEQGRADEEMILSLTRRIESMETLARHRNDMMMKVLDVLNEMITDTVARQFLVMLRELMVAGQAHPPGDDAGPF